MKGEDDLVRRAKGGDIEAFAELFLIHKDRVYNIIYRMIGNVQDAEDLTQETFLKAFLGIKGFSFRSSFSTWLCKIAINTCVDMIRRRKFEPKELSPVIPDRRNDLEIDERVVISRRIQEAFLSLPPEYRAVLLLRDVEGLSYKEIAESLGIPIGTVRSSLYRAREMLRKRLVPYRHLWEKGG
jgi:RNA polymerase sigma-70 factor (ECF subfamily)